MPKLLKTLPLLVCMLLLSQVSFTQEEKTVSELIIGEWDVVLEAESGRLSLKDLELTKERSKDKIGNSNKALFKFNEDGKFRLTSIRDYSMSDEDGIFALSEDGATVSRIVKFPRHIEEDKRKTYELFNASILYIDESFLVIRGDGLTYYMHKMK